MSLYNARQVLSMSLVLVCIIDPTHSSVCFVHTNHKIRVASHPGEYYKKKKKKKWVWTCDWKFRLGLPPNSKTTDELNLKHIFKPNFLFYSPINKLSLVQIQTFFFFFATDP